MDSRAVDFCFYHLGRNYHNRASRFCNNYNCTVRECLNIIGDKAFNEEDINFCATISHSWDYIVADMRLECIKLFAE